jgi:peptidyl-prolyl cis-trans isomerase D
MRDISYRKGQAFVNANRAMNQARMIAKNNHFTLNKYLFNEFTSGRVRFFMLSTMRAWAHNWIAKVLFGLIALSFVTWGVGDYINQQRMLPVAEVDGQPISPEEFSRAYEREIERMRRLWGPSLDRKTAEAMGLKETTLRNLVQRYLLIMASQKLRLTVSPEYMRQEIATTEMFLSNGHFDQARYEALLRTNQMTPRYYEQQMSMDLLLSQLREAAATVTQVPEALLLDQFNLDHEKRTVTLLTLDPTALEGDVSTDEATLATYLKEHQSDFMTQGQVKVQYAVLAPASLRGQVTLTPDEMQTYYDENSAEFQQLEKRHIRHILAHSNGSPEQDKAAQEKIKQAQERLKGGEPFEAVAAALSDDTTKAMGGDLGWLERGHMPPLFDKVAFSLAKDALSPRPVPTDSGQHLIQVTDIQAARTRTFEEASADVREKLTLRKSEELVYDRSVELEDQLYANGDLKATAEDMSLPLSETGFFTRQAPGTTGIEQEPQFLDAAFSTNVGELSTLIELPDARFFVLRVLDRKDPKPRTLEDARDEVTQSLKRQKAHELTRTTMDTALKALQDGQAWETVQAAHKGLEERKPDPFTFKDRTVFSRDALREAAFQLTLERALFPEVLRDGQLFTIMKLTGITPPDPKELEGARTELTHQLERELGLEQLDAFMESIGQRIPIKIHEEVFKPL